MYAALTASDRKAGAPPRSDECRRAAAQGFKLPLRRRGPAEPPQLLEVHHLPELSNDELHAGMQIRISVVGKRQQRAGEGDDCKRKTCGRPRCAAGVGSSTPWMA